MDDKQLIPVIEVIRNSLVEFEWLLKHIRKNHGQLKLPKRFIRILTKDEQQCWSVLYERPHVLKFLPLIALQEIGSLDDFMNDAKELLADISQMNEAKILELKNEFSDDLIKETDELLELFTSDKPVSLSDLREFKKGLEGDDKEEFQKIVNFVYFFIAYLTAQSFQLVALTTYGKSMCALVERAKNGDNLAFCQAVSIDRSVLIGIPYFQKKLLSLQLGNEKAFYVNFLKAFSKVTLPNKILYPELRIVFGILHDYGFLTKLSNSRLLKICEDLRIYSTEDKGNFDKIRTRFIKEQGHQI